MFENHRKVLFNITSEASYVYNLNEQKFIENAKNGPFWQVFENLKLVDKQCYQTKIGPKIDEKCQKFKCDILSNFQTLCLKERILIPKVESLSDLRHPHAFE